MNNVVLIGFMGSGKTTIGMQLADQLQRPFIDLDRDIEADAGRSISELFAAAGEAAFRIREQQALHRALQRDSVIIAVGGGAPLPEENWRAMRSGNTVVGLMAEPAELARRLQNGNGRPLLKPDAGSAISALLPERLPRYRAADLLIETDGHTAEQVVRQVADRLPAGGLDRVVIGVPPSSHSTPTHEAMIGHGLSGVIASAVHRLGVSHGIMLVTEPRVLQLHAQPLRDHLAADGLRVALHVVPSGEKAKTIEALADLYNALGIAGVDRQGVVIALGGGTVGDVAGFAAASWMRGIRYLQVPTTLLAMVDSSIGGKTGINLSAGKNMAGAVHQPEAVFADLEYLSTLPESDYRSALAEIIKSALIADQSFTRWLAMHLEALLGRSSGAMHQAVAQTIAIKAAVVSQDPNETGPRAILNYGHTVGHALERALGYGALTHGQAVAWGMEVAARIAVTTGRCTDEVAATQHALLHEAGLLEGRPSVGRRELLEALSHDKKARAGELRWVLLRGLGNAEYGCAVASEVVLEALAEVLGI